MAGLDKTKEIEFKAEMNSTAEVMGEI